MWLAEVNGFGRTTVRGSLPAKDNGIGGKDSMTKGKTNGIGIMAIGTSHLSGTSLMHHGASTTSDTGQNEQFSGNQLG